VALKANNSEIKLNLNVAAQLNQKLEHNLHIGRHRRPLGQSMLCRGDIVTLSFYAVTTNCKCNVKVLLSLIWKGG
jgi:hypothetical protein